MNSEERAAQMQELAAWLHRCAKGEPQGSANRRLFRRWAAVAEGALTGAQPAAAPSDGWLWMTHPDWNDGKPLPVQVFEDEGERFYRPFDTDATDFAWDERDKEWALAAAPAAPPADSARLAALEAAIYQLCREFGYPQTTRVLAEMDRARALSAARQDRPSSTGEQHV